VPADPAPAFHLDGIPIHVDGDHGPALLMVHGWPDTHRLWDGTVDALRAHRRCVRFTLPGFDVTAGRRSATLDETLALLTRIADAVSPDAPVELLVHDWGCLFGYTWAVRHPDRVRRMVGVDIGDAGSAAHRRALGLAGGAMVAGYQLWLALAWTVGGRVGDAMTRGFATLAGAPGAPETIGSSMDYPYAMVWSGRYARAGANLGAFRPPCPMLYLHGRRKPVAFHSPDWVAALEADPAHRVQGFDTGHWPMHEQPEAFRQAVLEWLVRTGPPADAHPGTAGGARNGGPPHTPGAQGAAG
jgi:pimeloyl-ACP methyl ester carboxylesterase